MNNSNDAGHSRSATRWKIEARREAELTAIIDEEKLRPDAARVFVDEALRDGALRTTGTAITKVLTPASRFARGGGHVEKKQRVIRKLGMYFETFFGLSSDRGTDGRP